MKILKWGTLSERGGQICLNDFDVSFEGGSGTAEQLEALRNLIIDRVIADLALPFTPIDPDAWDPAWSEMGWVTYVEAPVAEPPAEGVLLLPGGVLTL